MKIEYNLYNKIKSVIKNRKNIGLHEPNFNKKDISNVKNCISSTYVSTNGKYIKEFESKLKKITGAKYVIATNSGTSALHVSLQSIGAKDKTCIIVSPLSFVASANSIRYNNCDPIFVDCEKNNLSICPEKLKKFFLTKTFKNKKGIFFKNNKKKIVAILVTHVFGSLAKIDELLSISKKFGVPIVEDSAESLGCTYKKLHAGTFGKLGILSFNGNKIITTGAGGAILTNSKKLYNESLHLVKVAKKKHIWKFNHNKVGYNYSISNLSSALGCAQLDRLDSIIRSKKKLKTKYKNIFSNSEHFEFVDFDKLKNIKSNYWLNGILLKKKYNKKFILDYLNKKGLFCRPAWNLLCDLPPYKKFYKFEIKNAYDIEKRLILLPSSPGLV